MTDVKDIRAFLAIEPSETVLQTLAREQEKLKREIFGQVSWTRPQGQHLTLKFFDNISRIDADNIRAAVTAQAARFSPFSLTVEKLGAFPDSRRPKVLWSAVTGNVGELKALQGVLDADFESLGFARENRPYKPHITLARIKTLQAQGGIGAVLGRHDRFTAGEFMIRELILFQSRLGPQGAVYSKLAVIPLGG